MSDVSRSRPNTPPHAGYFFHPFYFILHIDQNALLFCRLGHACAAVEKGVQRQDNGDADGPVRLHHALPGQSAMRLRVSFVLN